MMTAFVVAVHRRKASTTQSIWVCSPCAFGWAKILSAAALWSPYPPNPKGGDTQQGLDALKKASIMPDHSLRRIDWLVQARTAVPAQQFPLEFLSPGNRSQRVRCSNGPASICNPLRARCFHAGDKRFDAAAGDVILGARKELTRAIARGEGKGNRGKMPLTFEEYCDVGRRMLESQHKNALYAHAVTTMMWNLISRAGNAVSICKKHLDWEGDCLLVRYAEEKCDHTMSRPELPRHVYANPYQPEICPILALGLYFLEIDVSTRKSEMIFEKKK